MPPPDSPPPFPDSAPRWRPSRHVVAGRAVFVGEADGPREQDLKMALLPVARGDFRVSAAYLVRMRYISGGEAVMALCLKFVFAHDDEDARLSDQIFTTFRPLFERDESLYLVFIDTESETFIREVCPPFFERKDRLDPPEKPGKPPL